MSEWQPIETAPKDGSAVLLWWPARTVYGGNGTYRGKWDTDEYASKPRPYWSSVEIERLWGKQAARMDPPTYWMPLPAPPGSAPTSRG